MYINFFIRSILLSVVFCIFFFPHHTFAANYTAAPLIIDHELKKRDIITETITLTNKDNRMIRIYPTVNAVSVNEGGTIEGFLEPSMIEDKSTAITSWIEITRGRIELKPGEVKEVTLTIRVNPEVAAGEYHAFIGFPEGSNRPKAESLVANGQVPGTILRVGVDKVQNQFLRLEKFSVDRFVKSDSEGDILFSLQNPGQDPVTPGGEIIFYDNSGNEKGSVPINVEASVIEAGKTVSFTQEVPNDLKIGKYKAFLSVEYGLHQTASIHDTAFFYVLPLKIIIIIFVVVLFLAIIIALLVHRKFDGGNDDDDGASEVALYVRQNRSESKDHDIDLSKKNES